MATIGDFKAGMKVYFGRKHGEQTLGTVVKVNRAKLKIRQEESRGTMRSYPIGTVWTVPPDFCKPADPSAVAAAPAPKRPEAEIIRDCLDVYCMLSPEHLSCDGELSRTEVARRYTALNRKLKALFTEAGRTISESECYASRL